MIARAVVSLASSIAAVLFVYCAIADVVPWSVGLAGGAYLVLATGLQFAGVWRNDFDDEDGDAQ